MVFDIVLLIILILYDYFVSKEIQLTHSAYMPCLDVSKPKRPNYLPLERYTKALSSMQRALLVKKSWETQDLDPMIRRRLRWAQKNYMVYNYCSDLKRFLQGLPRECRRSRFH